MRISISKFSTILTVVLSTIIFCYSPHSLAESPDVGENKAFKIEKSVSKLVWTVDWLDGAGHHRKSDQFKIKVVNGKVKKFKIKNNGQWNDTEVFDIDVFNNSYSGAGELWAANFYFIRKDPGHGNHIHKANFIFSLAGSKPIFIYDIIDLTTTPVTNVGAHGKGGGTGG